jgi:hypothetical protein
MRANHSSSIKRPSLISLSPSTSLQLAHSVQLSTIAVTMLSRHAPSSKSVTRILPLTTTAISRLPTQQTQNRGLATIQDAPLPKRVYGGLRDQDRIFQNLYGHHGADLKSAKKYGDWYKTKEILDKGHDWVWNLREAT